MSRVGTASWLGLIVGVVTIIGALSQSCFIYCPSEVAGQRPSCTCSPPLTLPLEVGGLSLMVVSTFGLVYSLWVGRRDSNALSETQTSSKRYIR